MTKRVMGKRGKLIRGIFILGILFGVFVIERFINSIALNILI